MQLLTGIANEPVALETDNRSEDQASLIDGRELPSSNAQRRFPGTSLHPSVEGGLCSSVLAFQLWYSQDSQSTEPSKVDWSFPVYH